MEDYYMKINITSVDRFVRIIVGLLFLGVLSFGHIIGIIGFPLVITGVLRKCPLYLLLKRDPFDKT
jgi:hypothetical protein